MNLKNSIVAFGLLVALTGVQVYAETRVDKPVNRVEVRSKGLANPERGFRFEVTIANVDGEGPYMANNWPFPYYKSDGVTMTQAYCYLTPYCEMDSIPQCKLDALQADFDRARRDGVKFVLRFAYQHDMENVKRYPSLDVILGHIKQLTPIVRKNIDVIYVLQTGWVGAWGEFHSDPNHISLDPTSVLKVLQATLDMLPSCRKTMMRRMAYRDMAESVSNGTLDVNRVGFFNDGTLASYTDGSTFSRTEPGEPEFDKVTRESADLPVDGELFWSSAKNLVHANALSALERFIKQHYTTFSVVHSNSELDGMGTIDAWKATPFTAEMLKNYDLPCDENYFKNNPMPSGYEYIRDHLGYRLEVTHSEGRLNNTTYTGSATIRNVGCARPINPRKIYLVLYNEKGDAYEFSTGVDAHSLEPWNEFNIHLVGELPKNAPKGDYKAALWLPDEQESIRYRQEYAITIASGTTPHVIGGRVLNTLP